MASESVVQMPEADFDSLYSKLLTLEAIADVCMAEPSNHVAMNTLPNLRSALYFGITEAKNLLVEKGNLVVCVEKGA